MQLDIVVTRQNSLFLFAPARNITHSKKRKKGKPPPPPTLALPNPHRTAQTKNAYSFTFCPVSLNHSTATRSSLNRSHGFRFNQ